MCISNKTLIFAEKIYFVVIVLNMVVDLFALCDFAKNDGGRLTIIDTFDNIRAEKLPWRAYFGFAIKLRVNPEDFDNKELTLKIFSQKKNDVPLFCASTRLTVNSKKGILAIAGNLKGLLFENAGEHDFKVYLDGNEIYTHTFSLEVKTNG